LVPGHGHALTLPPQQEVLMADGRPGVGGMVRTDGSAGPLPLGETRLEIFKQLGIKPASQLINVPKEAEQTTGSQLMDKVLDKAFSDITVASANGTAMRELVTENSDPRSITKFPPENRDLTQTWYEDPPLETTLGFPVVRAPHPHQRFRESMRVRKSSSEDYPFIQEFKQHYDLLVVGGGLVGSLIAYSLVDALPVKSGVSVAVIERDPSYRYSLSTCSPLGLSMQHCSPELVEMALYGSDFLRRAHRRLAVDSGLEAEEEYANVPDVKFQGHGHLTLASTEQMPALAAAHEIQRLCGAQTAMLTLRQLEKRFPWLSTQGVMGGCLGLESEGWFDPWNLLQSVKMKNQHLGVDYINGEVIYFKKHSLQSINPNYNMDTYEDGSPVPMGRNFEAHILLPDSNQVYPIHFHKVVLAGGGETGNLARMCGIGMGQGVMSVEVPVERKRDYMFRVASRKGPGLNCPQLLDPNGLILRREGLGGHYRVGRLPSKDSEEVPTNLWGGVSREYWEEEVLPLLRERVPSLANPTLISSELVDWDHNYYDGCPIIGFHPYMGNVYLACGLGGSGPILAPAIGRAITELIHQEGYETIDLSRFSFDRVLAGRTMSERFRAPY